MNCLCRRGVFPYDYLTSAVVLDETQLPAKASFYNTLKKTHISDEEYNHAQNVWRVGNCKTIRDYMTIYVTVDVLLLAEVYMSFRNTVFESYKLDPAYFISTPALSLECTLVHKGLEI